MTALADTFERVHGSGPTAVTRPAPVDVVAAASMVVALYVWAVPLTHTSGGTAGWVLPLAVLSVVPGLVATRPWRQVSTPHLLLALAPAAAAAIVSLVAPTRWDGLDDLAMLAYAGSLYLVVRGWAVDAGRRLLVLVAVALAGLEQFSQAYLAWWGGGVVERRMVGTFFWHNQYAAYVLAAGLVAAVLAVRGTGRIRLVGWLTAPPMLASLAFASSRSSIGIGVLLWSAVVILSFVDRRGRVSALAMIPVIFGLATFLASPLLMEQSGSAVSTVAAREAQQSLSGNGNARLELWKAAWRLGSGHPVTGAGFDSFAGAGSAQMPAAAGLSTYVHNGYLQAFSDGGLLLLLAVTLVTGLPLLASLRFAMRRRRRQDRGPEVLAVPVALVALVLHSGVDFDWTYPSLVAMFAVLAAAVPRSGGGATRAAPAFAIGALVMVMGLVVLPGSVRASALHFPGLEAPGWVRPASLGLPLHRQLAWLPAAAPCRRDLQSPDAPVRRRALECVTGTDRDDPTLALARAGAEVRAGRIRDGVARAEAVVAVRGEQRPLLRYPFALVLADAGDDARATEVMDQLRQDLTARGLSRQRVDVDRALQAQRTEWAQDYRRRADPPIQSEGNSADGAVVTTSGRKGTP